MNNMKNLKSFYCILFSVCVVTAFSSCAAQRSVHIPLMLPDAGSLPLTALNKNAAVGSIVTPEKDAYAFFSFSENKKLSRLIQSGQYALEVTVEASAEPEPLHGSFFLSFLYGSDFSSATTLKESVPARNKITARIRAGNTVALSFGFPDAKKSSGSEHPIRGFAVHSSIPLKIKSAAITPLRCGWKKEKGIRWFGAACEGGQFPSEADENSDAISSVFIPYPSAEHVRTYLNVFFEGNAQSGSKIRLSCGKKIVELRKPPDSDVMTVDRGFFDGEKNQVCVSVVSGGEFCAGLVVAEKKDAAFSPITADPELILNWPQQSWRNPDYELFSWEQFPSVLIFDCADYDIQNTFFKRLAFYAEKKGCTGTLFSDEKMRELHAFNAHDYRAETVAAFFQKAEDERFPLNEAELLLRDILFANKVIIRSGTTISAGNGALVSFSRESTHRLRSVFITHECLHGIYFTQPAFRDCVDTVFDETDKRAVAFLRRYFEVTSCLNYNTDDPYLLKNEFMAYILQQPVPDVAPYFVRNVSRRRYISAYEPALCAYIRKTNAAAFVDAAVRMSDFLEEKWGITAGSVSHAAVLSDASTVNGGMPPR